MTIHHIVSDGWAIGVMTRELGALYDAYCRGLDSPLAELALQYGDFAVWQEQGSRARTSTTSLVLDRQAGPSAAPGNPDGSAASGRPGGERRHRIHSAAAGLTDGLKEYLSHREKATLFMLTLAALKILLQRRSGRSDMFVGTVLAGRSRVELEPLIGLFINPLVFRTDLSGDPTFLELLARVRETVLEALAHQDVPFERVVEAVQPKRDPSRHPVFQINFMYQRDFVQPLHASGLTLTAIPSVSPGAIYDLNFFLVERAEGWRASCEYNTDLYERSTVRRLLEQFRGLLEGIAADPTRRISEFLLTSPGERNLPAPPADQAAGLTVLAHPPSEPARDDTWPRATRSKRGWRNCGNGSSARNGSA